MNEKTLLLFSKIFGVLYFFFGVIVGLTALLGVISSGTVAFAEHLASQIGKSVGEFPHEFVLLGAALIMVLAAFYFAGSFGLLKRKKWAYMAVAGVGVAGLLSNGILAFAGGKPSFIEILWSMFYLFFAQQISVNKKLFKN